MPKDRSKKASVVASDQCIQVRVWSWVLLGTVFKLQSEEHSTVKGKAVWQKQSVSIAEDPRKE